ncbi:MAG TPA: ATP-binding cassette domain-containing protein, partial [Planctomycetota bacterium]|nr:ATP-binding cassette domain-containing protein [Planctomycetota bacterium]
MSVGLELRGVEVALDGASVIRALDFAVPAGGVGVLVGPSGAGKSTALRAAAGLVRPKAGEIRLGGRSVSGPGGEEDPARRRVGFLFQGYALWPHLTVERHLRFVLDGARLPRGEQRRRIDEVLEPLGLAPLRDRLPESLS